jgi:two-component system response regulator AlgR
MKILIVDDEAPARQRLAGLVQAVGGHELVGEAATGADAVAACERLKPDVVLLDIRMPGGDGLAAAARINRIAEPPAIIFVTAFGDHALAAFDAEAVDYLLKPVRRERLSEALQKARRLNRAQLKALQQTASDGRRQHLLCRRRGDLELIPIDDVRFLQADQKYVTVNHLGGEDLIEDSLRQLEDEFADRFFRIHRNALVAHRYLIGLERSRDGRYQVRLHGCETPLEVSRRHVAAVKELVRRLGD